MKRYSFLLNFMVMLAGFAAATWLLTSHVRAMVRDRISASGTEHVIQLWKQGIQAYTKDHGEQPGGKLESGETQARRNDNLTDIMFKHNRLVKLYIEPTHTSRIAGTPIDGWQQPLIFDADGTGDMSVILSVGPDGKRGTADDISSKNVRSRKIKAPQE